MKQYLLFAGDYYYPSGGMSDLHGQYDNFEEALQEGENLINLDESDANHKSWAHIQDIKSGNLTTI